MSPNKHWLEKTTRIKKCSSCGRGKKKKAKYDLKSRSHETVINYKRFLKVSTQQNKTKKPTMKESLLEYYYSPYSPVFFFF